MLALSWRKSDLLAPWGSRPTAPTPLGYGPDSCL